MVGSGHIVRFGPKEVLTALKRVYKVKRSPYLYSPETFPPIQCGMSQTPPMQTQCPHCVPWDYGVKQINTIYGTKQTPTSRSRIGSDTICNDPLLTV